MDVKIDWLSFTVPIYASSGDLEQFATSVMGGLFNYVGQTVFDAIFNVEWGERKGGRAPYAYSHDIGKSGIVVFSSPKRGDVLIELSGKACDFIRYRDMQKKLLERVQNTVTRIDLACDMETSTKPNKFAPRANYSDKIAYSDLTSQSGQTVYIGSMKSERYTRVYRYKAPHPRHRLLRVEFVFRRKVARAVVGELLVQGEMAIAQFYGNKNKFNDDAWKPNDNAERFSVYERPEREAGKTVFWLISSVAPSFKRLVREGIISNPEDFLNTYFLQE